MTKTTIEELAKHVPQIMKKRPVGRLAVKKKYQSYYTTSELEGFK